MSKILDLHIFAGWVGAVTTRHAEARGDSSFLFRKFVNFVFIFSCLQPYRNVVIYLEMVHTCQHHTGLKSLACNFFYVYFL